MEQLHILGMIILELSGVLSLAIWAVICITVAVEKDARWLLGLLILPIIGLILINL